MSKAAPELDVAGAIDRHFEAMDPGLRNRVADLADLLGQTATTNLRTILPECLIATPVAMLDETKMDRTIDVLRPSVLEQQGYRIATEAGTVGSPEDRYWVTINGNTTPLGAQNDFSMVNFLPVLSAVETEPDFPLAYFPEIYQPGTPICTVRADLADATIELYARQCQEADKLPEDIMLANFDADTRGVYIFGPSKSYMRQLAEARRNSRAAYLEIYPRLGHEEIDEERFPNIQRLIKWRDYMNGKFGFSFAAHYAVNLYGYLDSGGYNRSWDNNEQLQMGRALAARAAETGQRMQSSQLDGVMAVVSPRRYVIDLMSGNHMGYGALKVPADGQRVHVDPAVIQDLSKKDFQREVEYEVRRICERGLEKFAAEYKIANSTASDDEARQPAFERAKALIKEENEDMPKVKGMEQAILRALADFADEHDF